jgi:hypothetical protein
MPTLSVRPTIEWTVTSTMTSGPSGRVMGGPNTQHPTPKTHNPSASPRFHVPSDDGILDRSIAPSLR